MADPDSIVRWGGGGESKLEGGGGSKPDRGVNQRGEVNRKGDK